MCIFSFLTMSSVKKNINIYYIEILSETGFSQVRDFPEFSQSNHQYFLREKYIARLYCAKLCQVFFS